MLIQQQQLTHFLSHYFGYGSWNARTWFVAYEEGGGDLPEEVAEKFGYFFDAHGRADEPTLCDVRALYERVTFRENRSNAELFNTLADYRFGKHAMPNGVWKNLIAFEHGFRNKKLPDPLAYQRKSFLSPAQNKEALIQLYPLPSPHNHAWYYAWLDMPQLPFLKTRAKYEQHVFPDRINALMKRIAMHQPDLVLMYGMNNINEFKAGIQEHFSVKFKSVSATKLKIPQHHLATINKTTLVITTQLPALRHNRVETGFEWELFGKLIAKSRPA